MKKVILAMLAIFTVSVNANALSVQRSREEARFLTDKMMYELNLTDDQADDVYEINYDYFRSLGPIDGFYDTYYDRRYEDLSYVLYDWQWDYFLERDYFLHPAYIYRGGWAFGIYNYYTRAHFFYGIPRIFYSYDGGHFRHMEYYRGRFEMHRHAVERMPRGERRMMGGRMGMDSRGGMNRGGTYRSMDRGGNMDRMNRGGSNMDMNRGGSNMGSMNRGDGSRMDMNRGGNSGSMNRGSSNMGSMNRGGSSSMGMNRGGNSSSMNRGSSNMGSMSRSGGSSMQRSSSRAESRGSSNSRSHGGNSGSRGGSRNGGGSRGGR